MNTIDKIIKRTPLETKLKVAFRMQDYDNWKDGEYFGCADKYVSIALDEIEQHIKKHHPEIDLKELKLRI